MKKIVYLSLFCFMQSIMCSEIDLFTGIFSADNNKSQEDASLCIKKDGYTFLGVFDGHAGKTASFILQSSLVPYFFESLQRLSVQENNKNKVKNALLQALGKIENEMLENLVSSGSTATVGIIKHKNNSLHIAQVGDSSLFLYNNETLQFAPQYHDFEDEKELKRVVGAGGQVYRYVHVKNTGELIKSYDWRINGLNMTRSIGDASCKGYTHEPLRDLERIYTHDTKVMLQLYTTGERVRSLLMFPKIGQIIADPDYTKIKLTPANRWIILVSDGFSDFITPEQAICMVMEYDQEHTPPAIIAERLVKKAIELGSSDNVTVIIHDLLKAVK